MKILTMCQGGNVRSVSLAWLLKYKYNHDAIACSWEKNSAQTITMLGNWADHIVILEPSMAQHIGEPLRSKLSCYNVGPDRWGNCFHPELTSILDSMIQRDGAFIDKSPSMNDNAYRESHSVSGNHI